MEAKEQMSEEDTKHVSLGEELFTFRSMPEFRDKWRGEAETFQPPPRGSRIFIFNF